MNKKSCEVSIVIVCMNNLKNLFPCIDSIVEQNTKITYEIVVVAYLFSPENLRLLKLNYSFVTIIESNEIRGFSENNNLGLKISNGTYVFVLNDDTHFNTPVVDNLYLSMINNPQITVLSPDIRYPNGEYQICGRRRYNWFYWVLASLGLEKLFFRSSKYENKKGFFKSYNISGAAFMVARDKFKELGFFDETYFFSPEDIALSTKINKLGGVCYVDENVKLYHIASGTSSPIQSATMPSHTKGSLIFFSEGNKVMYLFLSVFVFFVRFFKGILATILIPINKKRKITANANFNTCLSIFSDKSPKEIFIKYYSKL